MYLRKHVAVAFFGERLVIASHDSNNSLPTTIVREVALGLN
jgi:hypothetical protein